MQAPRQVSAWRQADAADSGNAFKILATGQSERRSFSSGPTLTPKRIVAEVKKLAGDCKYDVASIGLANASLCGCRLWEEATLPRASGLIQGDAHEG